MQCGKLINYSTTTCIPKATDFIVHTIIAMYMFCVFSMDATDLLTFYASSQHRHNDKLYCDCSYDHKISSTAPI